MRNVKLYKGQDYFKSAMTQETYPIREVTRVNRIGTKGFESTYIRVPANLYKSGKFPFKNLQSLIMSIESEDMIVIRLVK